MMNSVNIIGRLTKDPELKCTPKGNSVITINIAVAKVSSKEDDADFIPVVIWGKQAENFAEYMKKGYMVGINGRLSTRKYETKDGQKRYVMEVVADDFDGVNYLSAPKAKIESSKTTINDEHIINDKAEDNEDITYKDDNNVNNIEKLNEINMKVFDTVDW